MAKILMVNLPYAGHTNPTLPLARQLVNAGHDVAYINAPEWREAILETGAVFIPYEGYPSGLSEQKKKTLCFAAAFRTVMRYGKEYELLIYEMLFYPAKKAAERLGIPCVRQFSQPAWNEKSYNAIKSSSRLFQLSSKLIDLQMMNRRTMKEIGVDRGLVHAVINDKPGLNIVYVAGAFQPLRDTFDASYLFVGPPVQPGAHVKNDFAATKKPLIYISMGSIMSSRIFCKRCIKAFADKDVTVILATGRINPSSLGELPSNITAYAYAPQMDVLRRADLFITHAGMNSVNEALYFGVPMLALPVMNDQPSNAEQLVRLGIGKRMRAFPTTSKLLYEAAMGVLHDRSIKDRSIQIGAQIRSDREAGNLVRAVEALL